MLTSDLQLLHSPLKPVCFFLFFSIYIYILCLFNFDEFCSLGDFDILEIQPYSGFTFIKHITET